MPMSQDAYRAYGDLISARDDLKSVAANQDMAKRFGPIGKIQDFRPGRSQPVLSVYRCEPKKLSAKSEFEIQLLERHPYSTQIFIPLRGSDRFLTIVAGGKDKPDLRSLCAFVVPAEFGITYHPGVWHHPIVALDQETDFASWVWEDGTSDDCEEFSLQTRVSVFLSR